MTSINSGVSAVLNTTGSFAFEFGTQGVEPWGRYKSIGSDDDENTDIDRTVHFYDVVRGDDPAVLYLCNEHYGKQSHDIINDIPLVHSSDSIVGSSGFAFGHSLTYLRPMTQETYSEKIIYPQYSVSTIPKSILNGHEVSLEFLFKHDTYQFKGNEPYSSDEAFNIITLCNNSLDIELWGGLRCATQ